MVSDLCASGVLTISFLVIIAENVQGAKPHSKAILLAVFFTNSGTENRDNHNGGVGKKSDRLKSMPPRIIQRAQKFHYTHTRRQSMKQMDVETETFILLLISAIPRTGKKNMIISPSRLSQIPTANFTLPDERLAPSAQQPDYLSFQPRVSIGFRSNQGN